MDCEKLKYFLTKDLRPRSSQHLPKVIIEWYSVTEICEEVWLSGDKDDASCVLETYSEKLSDYECKLLMDIIFGENNYFQYEDSKSDFTLKLHHLLDRILF